MSEHHWFEMTTYHDDVTPCVTRRVTPFTFRPSTAKWFDINVRIEINKSPLNNQATTLLGKYVVVSSASHLGDNSTTWGEELGDRVAATVVDYHPWNGQFVRLLACIQLPHRNGVSRRSLVTSVNSLQEVYRRQTQLNIDFLANESHFNNPKRPIVVIVCKLRFNNKPTNPTVTPSRTRWSIQPSINVLWTSMYWSW